MSFFDTLPLLPDDPILHLPIAYAADPRPQKVNLGIGAYRDEEGFPSLLTCVKNAEIALLKKGLDKEYAPIEGNSHLLEESIQLLFGPTMRASFQGGIFSLQSLGGTGALRLGGDFLSQETSKTIFLPNPSWLNHEPIFKRSGLAVRNYCYYDEKNNLIDFDGMCKDIQKMAPGSTILLHVCCHNPTGLDPSSEQWKHLSKLVKQQKLFPFFDFAYQGFAVSFDEDATPIRHFAAEGHEMLIAQSFSKNFGLYGERVGTLTLLTKSKQTARHASSLLKQLVRSSYSTPPRYGAQIIREILQTPDLKQEWLQELSKMRLRLEGMRSNLIAHLERKNKGIRDWSFLKNQKGFFSFCGLKEEQVQSLIKNYAIYMPANGRINVAGLNSKNIEYVADSINLVLQQ